MLPGINQEGINQGRRPELVGGEFVDYLLQEVDQKVRHQFLGQDRLKKVEQFIEKTCKQESINIQELKYGSRRGSISKIRSKLAISLAKEYGISFAEIARQLGVSTSAISKIISRSEK